MSALKTRLDRLEKSAAYGDSLMVIFNIYIGPSGWLEDPIGYHVGDEQMFREEGETMDDFNERAEAAVRAQAPRDALVLVLEPIQLEGPCEA